MNEHNALGALRSTRCALFLQATYGDGEPTDSAAAFHKWACDSAAAHAAAPQPGAGVLAGLAVAVFGLGNRQYEHFNAAAKSLDEALPALGGARLAPVGLGDDDGSLEDDFVAWRAALWPKLEAALPQVAGGAAGAAARRASCDAAGASAPPPLAYAATQHAPGASTPPLAPPPGAAHGAPGAFDARRPFLARLAARRELHAGGGRSCVHLEFDLASSGIDYEPGDHLGVLPENEPELVAEAAALLGLDPATVLVLKTPPGSPLPEPFPTPCTLATALTHYADLQSPPRKAALAALAAAPGAAPAERARLLALAAPGDAYAAFVTVPQRSLLETMAAFPTARPSLGVFFAAVAPRLAVRYYSISSSPRGPGGAKCVSATVAVVDGESPTGRHHAGVASCWLARRAAVGSRVPLFVRTSSFRLPRAPAVPIVMVGPGTGLAPFRGFLQERAAMASAGTALGPATLFFGCRAPGCDDIYADELRAFCAPQPPARGSPAARRGAAAAAAPGGAPPLSELELCFSRQAGQPKRYVQAALAERRAAVWAALQAGGALYVCGDARAMAKDVHKALLELLQQEGGMAAAQAEAYAAAMAKEARYQRDVW